MDTLLRALGEVTYDDLIDDLERYSSRGDDPRARHPGISMDLVKAAMGAADECPVCLWRFVNLTGKHDGGCPLAPLLKEANRAHA